MKEKNKGITLIILIITITILLILVGVTIGNVMDNMQIKKARNAENTVNTKTTQTEAEVDGILEERNILSVPSEEATECEHWFNDWVIINEPTNTQTGLVRRTCKLCGYVEEVEYEE